MTKFDEIFNGTATVNNDQKITLVRNWLKTEYNIDAKNPEVLLSLLEVHAHGGDTPKHFGHPLVSSSFGRAIFQIVFITGRWHLSFRKEPQTEFKLIHPKSEGRSWTNPQNRSAAGDAGAMLKTGALGMIEEAPVVDPTTPRVLVDGSNIHLHIPEATVDDSTPDFGAVDPLAGLDGLGSTGYSSVTIDLGSLGFPTEDK